MLVTEKHTKFIRNTTCKHRLVYRLKLFREGDSKMAHLTETQRIEILIMIGCGDKVRSQNEVVQLFNEKYPDSSVNQSTISRILNKFTDTGSVQNIKGRGRQKIGEDTQLDVMLDVTENPQSSVRNLARHHGISHSTVWRLLRKEKFHPYKIKLLHELNEDDPDRRLNFCETMMERLNRNPDLLRNILFSDESTFHLNGEVNRHNCRYWAQENPHWMREHRTQHPQKVNVWAGIIRDRVVGPYFFEGNLTGEMYLDFLRFELIPALAALFPNDEDPDVPHPSIWFQQDGAPPHYALPVREFLDQTFTDQWIGRRGFVEWPARSPDLNPLDFFMGLLKNPSLQNQTCGHR